MERGARTVGGLFLHCFEHETTTRRHDGRHRAAIHNDFGRNPGYLHATCQMIIQIGIQSGVQSRVQNVTPNGT